MDWEGARARLGARLATLAARYEADPPERDRHPFSFPDELPIGQALHDVSKRTPLPEKSTPAVRRGRKATGQALGLTAGLPKEGRQEHAPGEGFSPQQRSP